MRTNIGPYAVTTHLTIDSIYKIMLYRYKRRDRRKLRYPAFPVQGHEEIYFRTLEEVESYIRNRASWRNCDGTPDYQDDSFIDIYAYVVIEIPLALEVNIAALDQNLSIRIYRADGTLWGENRYANFFPRRGQNSDGHNYWGRRNLFFGRNPEEIRFKPGDIVEILGHVGNSYFTPDSVELAIIVKTPPTREEVAKFQQQYVAIHGESDVCDYNLGLMCNQHMDTYEVIPYSDGAIDHAPTISVFPLSKPISARRRATLEEMYHRLGLPRVGHNYAKTRRDEELSENVTYLPTTDTNLSADIIVDSGESYLYYNHPLCLYVVKDDKVYPATISSDPSTIDGYQIPDDIRLFIVQNISLLTDLANMKIDGSAFFDALSAWMVTKYDPLVF